MPLPGETRRPAWLPIDDLESEIVSRLGEHGRLILQAPTGSGKSTRLPQILRRHGFLDRGQVVILQPRRLAARLLAHFVAGECSSEVGDEVGYQVRFENYTGPATRIRFVTEGILLRQMLVDPRLGNVQVLVFDEFHERHLYGDISLAQALDLQQRHRPDLRIVVMSATLESEALTTYLHPCSVLRSEGRTFPVELEYAPYRHSTKGPPVWELAADAFQRHVHSGGEGDVLVFMPGSYEIQQTLEAVRHLPESKGFVLLPLHGELPPRDQDAAVARYAEPKVIVSTNVAETSVTIDGVRLVIDSGLARQARYDPNRGINTLLIEKISQASADQRAGRAGRTASGRCVRLWSLAEHQERPRQEQPEVRRLDLAEVALTLKASGVADLRQFRWFEAPAEQALADAETLLADLGAIDHDGRITPLGGKMLAFPVHPRYSRLLLAAQDRGCVRQAALIAALTQGRDLWLRNPGSEVLAAREDLLGDRAASDFWLLTRAWNYAAKQGFRLEACRRLGIHAHSARQVGPLWDQFLDIARREGLDVAERQVPDEALQKCILTAFADRVARRLDRGTLRCELVHGRRGVLARESAVQDATLLAVAEVREIEGAGKTVTTLLSLATAIDPAWLDELFPEDVQVVTEVRYDPQAKRVVAEQGRCFHDLPLETRRVDPPPAEAAARLLADEIEAGRLQLPHWDHAVEQWIQRLNLLARQCPDLELPAIGPRERREFLEQICHGAVSWKDLKERPVRPVVHGWLSAAQREELDRHAPERLTLPNNRQPRIVYSADGAPYVSLRIQELFGVQSVPRVARGTVGVLVHILAPNMRPVQITQDLAGFWHEHYPRLKQELQRKYPKHEWR